MQAMCQARQKQVRKGRSMDIVYEDKRIVVAVKPAGIVSVDQPGGMPELLRQTLHTACIRTVHRLDAPVAGLMVFARSAYAAGELSRQIREGEFGKTYLAVVQGMPKADEGELTDLLGRDKAENIHQAVLLTRNQELKKRVEEQMRSTGVTPAALACVEIHLKKLSPPA